VFWLTSTKRALAEATLSIVMSLVGLVLALSCVTGDPVFAAEAPAPATRATVDQHDRGDFLPFLPTWFMKQLFENGYAAYKMDARTTTWPGQAGYTPRETIKRCFAIITQHTGIPFYDVTGNDSLRPDLIFYMPDGMSMSYAGEAHYANSPASINVNFRQGYSRWDSTYCHELGHVMGQEDLYTHPLTCNTFATWTQMSCGTSIGVMTPYDRDIQRNVVIPDQPAVVSVTNRDGYLHVLYNGYRRSSAPAACSPYAGAAVGYSRTEKDNYCGHYNRVLDNATRVAVFVSDDNGASWIFTGVYGQRPWVESPESLVGVGFERWWYCPTWTPNRLWGVRPESNIPSTWYGWEASLPYISGDIGYAGRC
jgi:hypothetical protein